MVFENLSYSLLPKAKLNYYQAGVVAYCIEAIIWALIFGLTALFPKLLSYYFLKPQKSKSPDLEESEPLLDPLIQEDSDTIQAKDDLPVNKHESLEQEPQNNKIKLGKALHIASKFLLLCSVCCVAIVPSFLSSVELIPVVLAIFINFLVFLLIELLTIRTLCPRHIRESPHQDPQSTRPKILIEAHHAYQNSPKQLVFITALGILYSIFMPLVTAKACLAYYSPDGTIEWGAFGVSTAFSRFLAISQVCPLGKICHTYSTLADDGSSSVILNVHTGIDITSLEAQYDTNANFQQDKALPLKVPALSVKMDIESRGARYIHSMYLDGLAPNTDYYVNFVNNGNVLGDAHFSTLPSKNMESNIVLVGGGDSSGNEVGKFFISEIAKYNPNVIFVGGDLVYDNGDYHCYYCWDVYLKQFELLNQRVGRLVPLIFGIGNHDIGYNHNEFLNADPYKIFYYLYFPQHLKLSAATPQIPLPDERGSYFSHKIGNTLLMTLDSGYNAESGGKQFAWMQDVVANNTDYLKLAQYHFAIFAACEYDPARFGTDDRMFTWVPLFEENRFMTVFENHFHLLKKTFPLKFTNADGPGVVYSGDGGWGITPDDCFDKNRQKNVTGVFDRLEKLNHVWITTIGKNQIDYKAIGINGETLHSYSQDVADYVL